MTKAQRILAFYHGLDFDRAYLDDDLDVLNPLKVPVLSKSAPLPISTTSFIATVNRATSSSVLTREDSALEQLASPSQIQSACANVALLSMPSVRTSPVLFLFMKPSMPLVARQNFMPISLLAPYVHWASPCVRMVIRSTLITTTVQVLRKR
jgi:hypothetical protein